MSKKLSPQGYLYGKNPNATNPFWEETSGTPTSDASDYVKSIAIAEKENTDGSKTYTVNIADVTDGTDGTKSTDIDVPAAIVEYVKSLTMSKEEAADYVNYTITSTDADGTESKQVIQVPTHVAAELTQYTKTVSLSPPTTNSDGSKTYTFVATNYTDGSDNTVRQTIDIPALGSSGPDGYVKSVTISDAVEIEGGTRYTIAVVTVNDGTESTTSKIIDVPTGQTITDYVKSVSVTETAGNGKTDYTIATVTGSASGDVSASHTISVPDAAEVPTEYVKTLTKTKDTTTGLSYLVVTDANDKTANITIGTLDSVTAANEATTTNGISKVSLTEVDADANSDVHDLAYILTEPMAITSLTQSTADDGTVTTSLNLAGTNQSGEAVTSSIAVQTKTESDGSTGVYLVLTNLNETSDKILSITSGGGGNVTVTNNDDDRINIGDNIVNVEMGINSNVYVASLAGTGLAFGGADVNSFTTFSPTLMITADGNIAMSSEFGVDLTGAKLTMITGRPDIGEDGAIGILACTSATGKGVEFLPFAIPVVFVTGIGYWSGILYDQTSGGYFFARLTITSDSMSNYTRSYLAIRTAS